MEKNIIQLIEQNYSTFSRTNKILSDFVKANIRTIPFMSINEIARQSGVSGPSITRFVRMLSFANFSEFIACARKDVQQDLAPWERIKRTVEAPVESSLKSMIDGNISSLKQMYNETFEAHFHSAVVAISKARRVYIIGARSSFSIAVYLGSILNNLQDNIVLLPQGDFSAFADATSDDCLIAIGFARYTRITCETANYFYDKGCIVIAITDSYTSPIALSSEYVLSVASSSSYPVAEAMSIAMYLTTSVAKSNPDRALKRMEEMEKLGDSFHTYI